MSSRTGIVKTELQFLRSNAGTLALALLAPFLFAFVVGSVYSAKKLTALPVTIVDQDNSALSREITSALLATEPFILRGYADSPDAFETAAAEGESHTCFVFPLGFERAVRSGKGSEVAVLVDASNLIAGNIAGTAAASVLGSYSIGVDIRKMQLRGVSSERARRTALPVSMQARTLYNPAMNGNYASFLVIGMLGVAIQLSAMLATARICEERVPCPAIRLGVIAVMISAGAWLSIRLTLANLDLPMRGAEWLLALVVFWFVGNMVAFTSGVSLLMKDPVYASEAVALLTMPNFLLSGYTWPIFAMPGALKVLAYALPMNPLIFSLRKISMMGAGASDLALEFILLSCWSAAACSVTLYAFSRSGLKSKVARA
jgi:ABC-2 type transport system permease protein